MQYGARAGGVTQRVWNFHSGSDELRFAPDCALDGDANGFCLHVRVMVGVNLSSDVVV